MSSLFFHPLFFLQGALMFIDEFYFHRRRGLGRWERWGHPVDSFVFFLALLSVALWGSTPISISLAVISCVLITKDEVVHTRACGAHEHWLHAMLFILHPTVLFLAHLQPQAWGIEIPFVVLIFCFYQIFYWNFYADRAFATRPTSR